MDYIREQISTDCRYKPTMVGRQPVSFDGVLRNVDSAPDEETDRFVAASYSDRRKAVESSSPE